MAARPFHDDVRAAVLSGAGDDRARQRPVPAEPAEPDQRPVRAGRSAPRLRPTTSITSASTSAASWRRWSAARSARCTAGTTASARPASACCSGLVIYLLGATLPAARAVATRGDRAARVPCATGDSDTILAAARRRHRRRRCSAAPTSRSATRMRAVGRRRRRSRGGRVRHPDDLVPVAESACS